MLVYCRASIVDGGPTLNQHWFKSTDANSVYRWRGGGDWGSYAIISHVSFMSRIIFIIYCIEEMVLSVTISCDYIIPGYFMKSAHFHVTWVGIVLAIQLQKVFWALTRLTLTAPVPIIFFFFTFFIRILHISFHIVKVKRDINQQEFKNS